VTAVPQPRLGDALPIGCFIDGAALTEVLTLAWATFVDPEAELIPVGLRSGGPGLVAEVAVLGDTPARIAISIDRPGARAVTERMAGPVIGPALDDDDVADAVGELANVLGGNLKALLPEGSTLTLPSVGEGPTGPATEGPGPAGTVVASVRWGDHLVTATVSATVTSSPVPSSTPVPAPPPKGAHP
jgi:CheY-specific phosphatase CheX